MAISQALKLHNVDFLKQSIKIFLFSGVIINIYVHIKIYIYMYTCSCIFLQESHSIHYRGAELMLDYGDSDWFLKMEPNEYQRLPDIH